MFNSILWTTTLLSPSTVGEEWDLVVIRIGFQMESAMLETDVRQD